MSENIKSEQEVKIADNKKIAILAENERFIHRCSNNKDKIVADGGRLELDNTCIFTVKYLDDTTFTLKADNGKYLSIVPEKGPSLGLLPGSTINYLRATSTTIDDSCKFIATLSDDHLLWYIKSVSTGLYLKRWTFCNEISLIVALLEGDKLDQYSKFGVEYLSRKVYTINTGKNCNVNGLSDATEYSVDLRINNEVKGTYATALNSNYGAVGGMYGGLQIIADGRHALNFTLWGQNLKMKYVKDPKFYHDQVYGSAEGDLLQFFDPDFGCELGKFYNFNFRIDYPSEGGTDLTLTVDGIKQATLHSPDNFKMSYGVVFLEQFLGIKDAMSASWTRITSNSNPSPDTWMEHSIDGADEVTNEYTNCD
ncbi:MAG: hypothetical protein FWE27_08115 [Defluviitaleaceae bacterium]|nr:hypothetical protein [Defluviitaleaceae bacterium]